MGTVSAYEFDYLVVGDHDISDGNAHAVSRETFGWLDSCCYRAEAADMCWLRPARWRGRRAVQLTNFVGVVQPPNGPAIEVLPKVGRVNAGGVDEARTLLIDMLRCMPGFRHIQTDHAKLLAARMPLLEVFIAEFLSSVQAIVKRGLRGDYVQKLGDLFELRGKLLVSQHLRRNLVRADRFFTEHDEFSTNRPENRLLRTALCRVLTETRNVENQRFARELDFLFVDIPVSPDIVSDFARVRKVRGMDYYDNALAWARLILEGNSPLTGTGKYQAPSLLFPMEAVFEAFVAMHLQHQVPHPLVLKSQVHTKHLVVHRDQHWFRLKPDLLLLEGRKIRMVLDTKWKLLDSALNGASDKYGLSEADFYQLHAYGHCYLQGVGHLALVYPKTDTFREPLKFDFLQTSDGNPPVFHGVQK